MVAILTKEYLVKTRLVVYYVVFTPFRWIGKDSLGIVYDVTHCFNLEKKCVPLY